MLWKKKTTSEPETETIKRIYNELAAIEKRLTANEAQIDVLSRKYNSITAKIWRNRQEEEDSSTEKVFNPGSFPRD